jgi:NitT/TauT family transport system ATP-binding protein
LATAKPYTIYFRYIFHQIDEAVFLSDRVLVLARRPGRILEDVRIDLPRPRTLATKREPAFVALSTAFGE